MLNKFQGILRTITSRSYLLNPIDNNSNILDITHIKVDRKMDNSNSKVMSLKKAISNNVQDGEELILMKATNRLINRQRYPKLPEKGVAFLNELRSKFFS